jgi:glycosyltransferase involved in cell wall biosynthesis
MNKYRVSYLLATFNREKFLKNAFDNFREFIDPSFDELIIIDGGSTDQSLAIINKNRDLITTLISETDQGEAHAFNKGLLVAKGELIKFLTDDDYFYPEAIQQAINILKANPEIDAIQCGGEAYKVNPMTGESELVSYQYLPKNSSITDIKNIFTYVPCGLGLFLTKRGVAKAGLFDISFRMTDIDYISKIITSKANYKYFNIKLFRHYAYDHSGQNSQRISSLDRARVKIRLSDWDYLMESPQETVGNVLGINFLRNGKLLLTCILTLDKLRRKMPFLFVLIGKIVETISNLLYFLRNLISNFSTIFSKKFHKRVNTINPISEPEWDSSLRG